jgi:hypothetical protein
VLLEDTPVPGPGEGGGAWPRSRAEFGPFVGLTANGAVAIAFGGYDGIAARPLGQLSIAGRFGYGLEGVVGSVNTGTMFLQAGVSMQTAQHDPCADSTCAFSLYGSDLLPRVPARVGLNLGARLPFWLVPGDLLLLTPVLAIASPAALRRVAIEAASGGLIPWQRSFKVPGGGVFEVVVGRTATADLFGVLGGRTAGWAERTLSTGQTVAFETVFRSVTLTFPVVDYAPFRAYAQTLTAALRLELAYAVDIPFDTAYLQQEGIPGPSYDVAHMALIRLSVDGRNYF